MLTAEDLRWAAKQAEFVVRTMKGKRAERAVLEWSACAARFRAAAEAMEREEKRDGTENGGQAPCQRPADD